MANGDVYELRHSYRVGTVTMLNRYHFEQIDGPGPDGAPEALADAFAARILPRIRVLQSDRVDHMLLYVRRISPAPWWPATKLLNTAGSIPGDSLPASTSLRITAYTFQGGVLQRCTWRFGGIAEEYQDGGVLNDVGSNLADQLAFLLSSEWTALAATYHAGAIAVPFALNRFETAQHRNNLGTQKTRLQRPGTTIP